MAVLTVTGKQLLTHYWQTSPECLQIAGLDDEVRHMASPVAFLTNVMWWRGASHGSGISNRIQGLLYPIVSYCISNGIQGLFNHQLNAKPAWNVAFLREIPQTPYGNSSQTFWHQGLVSWKTIFFFTDQGWGNGFGMIQVPYIYCALYFYYYYISSTSDHQA